MQPRKKQDKNPILLPKTWLDEVVKLLTSTYSHECEALNKSFIALGETYPDEALITISFLDKNNQAIIPVTLQLSTDLSAQDIPEDLINSIIDLIGVFFDQFFHTPDWDDYSVIWDEIEHNNRMFYYRISRENPELSLLADSLLQDYD